MPKQKSFKIPCVVHVVRGELGFDRAMRCTPSKLARIQQSEFEKISKAKSGFLRIEMPGRFSSWAEVHYEFVKKRGWLDPMWITSMRGEPARYDEHGERTMW